jgi:hypothetical protein
MGDLSARLLRGAAPSSGDPRAACESLSRSERGRTDHHTQALPEELLRRAGGAGEVDVHRARGDDRAGARRGFAAGAHSARWRAGGHAGDIPSRQLGVAPPGRDAAARVSGGCGLQAPARCLGGAAGARGALAFRRALDPCQGAARGLHAPPRRRARARHECRPGAGVHGQALLDEISGTGHCVLRRRRTDRPRHAPPCALFAHAAREPRPVRGRDSRALGRTRGARAQCHHRALRARLRGRPLAAGAVRGSPVCSTCVPGVSPGRQWWGDRTAR